MAQPYVIQCVNLACERASALERQRLTTRLNSLATIAATAPLLGISGTVLGVMGSFRTVGSSASAILADETNRISQSLLPTILGLSVAIVAFVFHRYLSGRLESFSREMRFAQVDLINRLIVHLQRLRTVDLEAWTQMSRCPCDGPLNINSIVESPAFEVAASYRPRVVNLVWPNIQSEIDAQVTLDVTGIICIGYRILAFLTCLFQHRWLAGLIVATFLSVAGLAVRKGFKAATVLVSLFMGVCLSGNLFQFGWTLGSICLALALLPLVASFKASTRGLSLRQVPLLALAALAIVAVLFGSLFGLYYNEGISITPTLHPGEFVLGVNTALTGPLKRGDLVEVMYTPPSTMRVATLPGDHVEGSMQIVSEGNYLLTMDERETIGPVPGELTKMRVVAAASLHPFTLPRWVH